MTYDALVAEIRDGEVWLWSAPGADHLHRDRIRSIPGTRYDDKKRQWHARLSWGTVVQLRGVFGPQLQIGVELNEWVAAERAYRVDPCLQLRAATSLPDATVGLAAELYPFQRAGVAFLAMSRQSLLADEMGAGKTVQVASALGVIANLSDEDDSAWSNPYPCLVIAPKSVKRTWARELARWCPTASVVVAEGSAAKRREAILSGADVIVVNYETARDHSRLAPYGSIALSEKERQEKELNQVAWATVVLDEAHRIKDPKAKQTRACWRVGQKAKYRYALTGTPIANAPDDLWSVMHFVAPDDFPTKTEFVSRYCMMAWNFTGGMDVVGVRPDTRDELFAVLDPRMRRMPKDLVLSHLPPKVREVRYCDMTPKQARAYRELGKDSLATIDGEVLVTADPMQRRLRQMQLASSWMEVVEDGSVKLRAPSSKVDELVGYLDDIGGGEPAVVFAQSRQLIELAAARLQKEGVSHHLIVGGMTEDERARSEREFQSGLVRVLLGTTGAAGEGITLTRARHLAFLQRSDKMIENRQAEDRVHRIGSEVHRSVVITDLVAHGTVEDDQITSLHEKFARLQEIARDRETLVAAYHRGDRAAYEALEKLAAEEQQINYGSV